MIAPGLLVMLAPLITGEKTVYFPKFVLFISLFVLISGTFFGGCAVYGLLTGAILSGVQMGATLEVQNIQSTFFYSPMLQYLLYIESFCLITLNFADQ